MKIDLTQEPLPKGLPSKPKVKKEKLYDFHEDFELESRRIKHLKELRDNAYH